MTFLPSGNAPLSLLIASVIVAIIKIPKKKTSSSNVKEKRKAGTRAGLTKAAIVAAAAKLIESVGGNGFSLRKLAKALGVGGAGIRYEQLNAINRVLTREGGYVAVGLDHYALPDDPMAKAAASRRLKRSFQGWFGASSIGSLPQGYVQNAPTAAAYAKEIEADRLATVRGIALNTEDRVRRDVIERIMCDLEVDIDAAAAEHRRSDAVEGGRVRRNAAVRGGRPGVLGRAAHRGQRTRAALRAVDCRSIRPLSRPAGRQAAPLAHGLNVNLRIPLGPAREES